MLHSFSILDLQLTQCWDLLNHLDYLLDACALFPFFYFVLRRTIEHCCDHVGFKFYHAPILLMKWCISKVRLSQIAKIKNLIFIRVLSD
jgi:hypothetical protein